MCIYKKQKKKKQLSRIGRVPRVRYIPSGRIPIGVTDDGPTLNRGLGIYIARARGIYPAIREKNLTAALGARIHKQS